MSLFDRFSRSKSKKKIEEKQASKGKKDAPVSQRTEVKPQGQEQRKKEKSVRTQQFVARQHVVMRPLVTEKASMLGGFNQYVFEVHPRANKIEIGKEITRMYRVSPQSVRIIQGKSKAVRYGRTVGKTKKWKKAIVTVKAGERIEVRKG